MDVCHYTFVQTLECILGVNSKVNNELRVIILCQCKFTSCNKGSTLRGGIYMGNLCTFLLILLCSKNIKKILCYKN